VRHVIIDGCSANEVAVRAHQLIHSFYAQTPVDETSQWAAPEREAIAFSELRRVHCIGHWTKNRIVELQKSKELSAGPRVVTLLSHVLYSSDDSSTKRQQLRIACAANKGEQGDVAQLRHAASLIQTHLDDSSTFPGCTVHSRKKLIPSISSPLEKSALGVADDEFDAIMQGPNAEAWLAERLPALQQYSEGLVASKPVPLATCNETRWHNSVYGAFKYVLANLAAIKRFCQSSSKCKSAEELVSLLDTRAKMDAVEAELHQYIDSLEPAAAFLKTVSDVAANSKTASTLYDEFSTLIENLMAKPQGSLGRELGELMHKKTHEWWLRTSSTCSTKDPITDALQHHFWVRLLTPKAVAHWVTYNDPAQLAPVHFPAELKLTPTAARQVFGMTETELPDEEWRNWISSSPGMRAQLAESYWWSPAALLQYPKLTLVARYLIRLPVSVTSCDSVLSVVGGMFHKTQNRLAVQKSASLVAFRCNGDVHNGTLCAKAFTAWGQ
jgi:hypothetical protein